MKAQRVLPTAVHALLDYAVGILLFFSPELFGFEEIGGAAVAVARVAALALIGVSLFTRFELGVVPMLSMKIHLLIDTLTGCVLIASPWLLGFSGLPGSVWTAHLLFGLVAIAIAMLSEATPRKAAQDPLAYGATQLRERRS